MEKLKPCPCGETPINLCLEFGNTPKYALVSGDCCGLWLVEFKTKYYELNNNKCMELAIKAWNKTPRKE